MKNLTKIVGVGLVAIALPFAALAGNAKEKNLNLNVAGISSESAQMKVQSTLSAIDGVKVQQVDSKSGVVHVMIDPEKTSAETVVSALKAAGFEARVQNEPHAGKKEY